MIVFNQFQCICLACSLATLAMHGVEKVPARAKCQKQQRSGSKNATNKRWFSRWCFSFWAWTIQIEILLVCLLFGKGPSWAHCPPRWGYWVIRGRVSLIGWTVPVVSWYPCFQCKRWDLHSCLDWQAFQQQYLMIRERSWQGFHTFPVSLRLWTVLPLLWWHPLLQDRTGRLRYQEWLCKWLVLDWTPFHQKDGNPMEQIQTRCMSVQVFVEPFCIQSVLCTLKLYVYYKNWK